MLRMIRTGNFPCRLLQSLRLLLVVPVDPVLVVVVRVGDDVAADVVGDSILQLRVGLSYSDTYDLKSVTSALSIPLCAT